MVIVHYPTRSEVRAQRDAIPLALGLNMDELARRADAGELVGEEWLAWAEVQELGWLLGE